MKKQVLALAIGLSFCTQGQWQSLVAMEPQDNPASNNTHDDDKRDDRKRKREDDEHSSRSSSSSSASFSSSSSSSSGTTHNLFAAQNSADFNPIKIKLSSGALLYIARDVAKKSGVLNTMIANAENDATPVQDETPVQLSDQFDDETIITTFELLNLSDTTEIKNRLTSIANQNFTLLLHILTVADYLEAHELFSLTAHYALSNTTFRKKISRTTISSDDENVHYDLPDGVVTHLQEILTSTDQLYREITSNNIAAVQSLCAMSNEHARVDLMAQIFLGNPALHWAVRFGHFDIVKILVEAGAEINALNLAGFTPLDIAFASLMPTDSRPLSERQAIIEFLQKHGAQRAPRLAPSATHHRQLPPPAPRKPMGKSRFTHQF